MIMPMITMTMIIDDTNVIMTMIMMQNKCGVESRTLPWPADNIHDDRSDDNDHE